MSWITMINFEKHENPTFWWWCQIVKGGSRDASSIINIQNIWFLIDPDTFWRIFIKFDPQRCQNRSKICLGEKDPVQMEENGEHHRISHGLKPLVFWSFCFWRFFWWWKLWVEDEKTNRKRTSLNCPKGPPGRKLEESASHHIPHQPTLNLCWLIAAEWNCAAAQVQRTEIENLMMKFNRSRWNF